MRLVYNKTTKAIVTVIVDDGSITSFPADHCVLQSDSQTLLEMSLAIGLNMPELIDYFILHNIQYAMTPELEQLFKDRAWGINFANLLLDKIKNQEGMSLNQRGMLLEEIHLFLTTLLIGDIQAAKAIMNSYTNTSGQLTPARKTWVITQITNAGY